jgi:hypothetical protein
MVSGCRAISPAWGTGARQGAARVPWLGAATAVCQAGRPALAQGNAVAAQRRRARAQVNKCDETSSN